MLLLGKSHGQMSLVGYSPWGCKESDTTEVKQASKQITCSCWVARYSNSFLFDLILSYFILLNSGKEQPASAGDTGDTRSIPGLVRSPAGRHGNPLQFSCLKNPMNRGAWRVTVERVTKSQTWLSSKLSTEHWIELGISVNRIWKNW